MTELDNVQADRRLGLMMFAGFSSEGLDVRQHLRKRCYAALLHAGAAAFQPAKLLHNSTPLDYRINRRTGCHTSLLPTSIYSLEQQSALHVHRALAYHICAAGAHRCAHIWCRLQVPMKARERTPLLVGTCENLGPAPQRMNSRDWLTKQKETAKAVPWPFQKPNSVVF